ncbi:MAG: hypothetical protein JWO03_553 [Bacteroidetes bacterium]|nr:hypothetical protein [Bacteroidota bacterium]
MKKTCLLSLLLIALAASTQAQVQHRKCGAMESLDQMIADNPSIAVTRQGIEEQTRRFIAGRGTSASRSSITIPVVVHVVYTNATQNISDAQILSQIAVLNADYGATNADRSGTPSAFQPVLGNPGIQFCMAQRDPNGNATNGIVRTSTTVSSFTVTDAVKHTSTGGDDAWASSSYLNLWVCNLGSGLLGYSQFPGGASATDGVVINYTAFGTSGTVSAPYDKGRTATHEIGHWMNLYHIWGNDNGACTGTDYVDDTPNQAGENFGCPLFPHISCTNGSTGDMFMNFMDYTDDPCMFMFSAGQATRIQSLFAPGGARASLTSSQGCVPPSSGTASCTTPATYTTGIVSSPTDTIRWSAVAGATSYILEYKPSASSIWASATTTSTAKYLTGLTPGTTYTYHVEAVCHTGSSTYSAVNSFTTAPSATCSDIYEPNESRTAAKSIATNTDIHAMISTADDKDYFAFSNTAIEPHIKLSLTDLPADYDLKLYNIEGNLLFTSQNNGTNNEYITFNNAPVGTYYAHVSGGGTAFHASDCYTLSAALSATTWQDAAQATGIADAKAEIQYNVYPNPCAGKFHLMIASSELLPKVTLKITDAIGRSILIEEYDHIEGMYSFEVNIPNAATGIYNVLITDGHSTEIRKVIVQK